MNRIVRLLLIYFMILSYSFAHEGELSPLRRSHSWPKMAQTKIFDLYRDKVVHFAMGSMVNSRRIIDSLASNTNDTNYSPESSRSDLDKPYPNPSIYSYHPLVRAEVEKVYADFGPLYISETIDDTGGLVYSFVSAMQMPWSGYWYPFRSEGIFLPLRKMDSLLRRLNHQSHIEKEEKQFFGLQTADNWEGMCDAWALASIMSKEPKVARTVGNIHFTISDQKALMTLAHSRIAYRRYGIDYRGDSATDGTYEDIKPEAFHKVVTTYLGQKKKAVVIDESAGIEVWSKPLYRYSWTVQQDPDCDAAFIVKSQAYLINHRNTIDDRQTSSEDCLLMNYSYRLYYDKNDIQENKYRVIAGQWINKSRQYHPGSVKIPFENSYTNTHNEEFNKNMAIYSKYFLS